MHKRFAFTLAEIIITLGIIGVIAAISIPHLIVSIQKHTIETKLKRFYAEMNQALKLSAEQNGVDPDGWVMRGRQYNQADLDNFVDTYLRPVLNISYTRQISPNPRTCGGRCPRILVVLNNGIAFSMYIDGNGVDVFMHPNPNKTDFMSTRDAFAFQMTKTDNSRTRYQAEGSFEPYTAFWNNGRESTLYTDTTRGCNKLSSSNKQYCTKIIQLNGWKFPKDYPW